jgi:two-component system, sensor histidine kinase RegB
VPSPPPFVAPAGAVARAGALDPHAVHRLNAGWIVRLRWAAIAGQMATISGVHWGMGIPLPLGALATLIAVSAASNLAIALWLRRGPAVSEGALGALMALDLCLFTGLLYFTGGPFNPFSSLYLVHLALAALVLSPRWTWSLVLLAVAANAALFVDHVPLPIDHGHGAHGEAPAAPAHDHAAHDHAMHGQAARAPSGSTDPAALIPAGDEPFGMHLQGMWVAFGVTAGFIVYFLRRVNRTLADREAELAQIRERSARSERLASMATLAAGAAHELGTPLSTIAVVARELERSAAGVAADDARLIREQVERCRRILGQMAGDAGESPGEIAEVVDLRVLVETALAPLEAGARVEVRFEDDTGGAAVCVPRRALSQALRNVVQNALEASPEGAPVEVRVEARAAGWSIGVRDRGTGMLPEVRERAADPFFTTKEPGRGMGLGLFLARSVLDFLGGSLEIESSAGEGTLVQLSFPAGPALPSAAPPA